MGMISRGAERMPRGPAQPAQAAHLLAHKPRAMGLLGNNRSLRSQGTSAVSG
jgi:hypothetical protein